MTFSPAAFNAIVNANQGFLKLTRYRVRFPIPQAMFNNTLATNYYNSLRTMEYYTDTFTFPGVAFLSHNVVRYGYGPAEKKPFAPSFNEATMTVYNDAAATNLDFFHTWMMLIQNFDMFEGINGGDQTDQTYEIFYKDEYAVDGQITLLDDTDQDVVTIRMRQMYPCQIPELQLGWALKQDIQRFTVAFCYTDWFTDWQAGGTLLNTRANELNNPTTAQQGLSTIPGQIPSGPINGPGGASESTQGIPSTGQEPAGSINTTA